MSIVGTLSWIEFKTYLRNRTALFWTFVNPLVTMIILMMVFGGEERGMTLPVDVYSSSTASVAEEKSVNALIEDLKKRPYLTVTLLKTSPKKRGALGISVRAEGDRLYLRHLYGESSHFEILRTAAQAAQLTRVNAETGSSNVVVESGMRIKERGSYGVYLVVGILTLTVISVCLFGFSVPLVEMRASGAGRMYQLFPMGPSTYMTAYVLSRIGVIILLGLTIVLFANTVYDLGFNVKSGTFLLNIILISLFSAVAFIGVGLVIASFTESVATANAVVNMIYLPLTLFSDIFLPLSLFPESLARPLSYSPVVQFVNGARAILVEQQPFWTQTPAFLSLGALAAVCFVIARLKFNWRA